MKEKHMHIFVYMKLLFQLNQPYFGSVGVWQAFKNWLIESLSILLAPTIVTLLTHLLLSTTYYQS